MSNQPDEFARPFVHEPGSLDDVDVREAPAGDRYAPGCGAVDQVPNTEGPAVFTPASGSPNRHPTCIDTYDGEIRYTDHLVDQVLNELADCGILDDTAVIINADHGEQLNQHYDCWGHPGLHDANTPFIMWRPGVLPEGARPEGYANHTDLAPTTLDLLDIEPMDTFDGVSLVPVAKGESELRDEMIAETSGQRSLTKDGRKYIWHKCAADELYNVDGDPMEVINLVDGEPASVKEMQEELFEWVARQLAGRPDPLLPQLAHMETLRGKPHAFL